MLTCVQCGVEFTPNPVVNGVRLKLHGRKHCLECLPLRHLKRPRKRVIYQRTLKTCEACGRPFPVKAVIDGKMRSLYSRRFCLDCSPFGAHNTSRLPAGLTSAEDLVEFRRKKRNAKTYRSQKRRRLKRKKQLMDAAGARCFDCGYEGAIAVYEFHHRDPTTKEFGLANFNGSLSRLLAEAAKCDLLCASCHRLRHVAMETTPPTDPVVRHRRQRKLKAIEYMGSHCHLCGRDGPAALFEFHHRNAADKEFGLSERGIPHSWQKTVAELAKCVMLCANCHREVHAGVRTLGDVQSGLAEEALEYAA